MWGKIAKNMSKLPIMVFVATILVASFVMLTVPAANALTQRNFQYGFDDNHRTARLGGTNVCGDHLCAPGEWDQLVTELNNAQFGQQALRNVNSTTPAPTTPVTTPAPVNETAITSAASVPTPGTSNAVCNSIENMLSTAGVTDSITTKVMADLGCSYK